jgi:allophanate hydrolase subunit 2
MAFEILSPGLFASIQDTGRHGFMHQGVTPSGAMDMYAYGWALKLLGEEEGNAIEAMVGLKLKALADTTIAITGADLGAAIDGSPIETWRSYLL